ncbi:MAG: hypothetical protein E6R11_00500 [Rhodocyclaceae bacterium]|nr:MAG: hypothetical protein E6R11_00500 [Rhodocyclaceae bacterium]
METQVVGSGGSRTARAKRWSLSGYLEAIAGTTAIFNDAVAAYLASGPEAGCWRHARQICERLGSLDQIRQRVDGEGLSKEVPDVWMAAEKQLPGLHRLLQDMKRQVTGFAIEAGFTGPDRRVPSALVPDIQALSDEVCAAVNALLKRYRSGGLAQESGDDDDGMSVGWHESRADRLSTCLIKRILADEQLAVESKLPLTQLVEEIDRVADYAQSVASQLTVN